MTTYFKRSADGSIGTNTTSAGFARRLGLDEMTDRELVHGHDGKIYISGEEPRRPLEVADYDRAMEDHLKAEQDARGYTTRSPAEYANSKNARWAQDAQDWVDHVTEVMEYALSVENAVKDGGAAPTLDEFKAGLPAISWTMED